MSAHGVEIGLLILRVVTGLVWAGHGTQKLFGWFGAKGRGTLEDEFSHLGYQPPLLYGYLAGVTETGAGLALAMGLVTPVAAGLLACVSVQAMVVAKWPNGMWIQDDGCEYLVVLAALGIGLAFIGPGDLSLDAAFGIAFAGVTAGIVAAAAALATPLLPRRVGAAPLARESTE
ncbi:MAG: DoxX family protein [Solirubrobacteraceae bacterium]